MVFLDKKSKKKVYQALNDLMGLGTYNAKLLCKKFGFQQKCRLQDLDSFELEQLKNHLTNNYILGKELTRNTNKDVKKKIDLGIYEGKRHNLGYPVRGQRTLSNGKTQRNLHKFRFYYNSDSLSRVHFKNKRKSIKNKKKKKLNENKNLNIFDHNISNVKKFNKLSSGINITKSLNSQTNKNNKISYLKKLEKVKAERKLQIDRKFKKDHQNAMKTHPYFVNIQKSQARKEAKRKKNNNG